MCFHSVDRGVGGTVSSMCFYVDRGLGRCLCNLKRVIPGQGEGREGSIEWGRRGMLRGLHGIECRYKWEPRLFGPLVV